jgi:hypothetical protein
MDRINPSKLMQARPKKFFPKTLIRSEATFCSSDAEEEFMCLEKTA